MGSLCLRCCVRRGVLPGDLLFFLRVLELLRGLATRLDVRQQYMELMAPYAKQARFLGRSSAGFDRGSLSIDDDGWMSAFPRFAPLIRLLGAGPRCCIRVKRR